MKRFTLIATVLFLGTALTALAAENIRTMAAPEEAQGIVALKKAKAAIDEQEKIRNDRAAEIKRDIARSEAEIRDSKLRIDAEQQNIEARIRHMKLEAPQVANVPVAAPQQQPVEQSLKKGPYMGSKEWRLDKVEAFYGKSMDELAKIGTQTFTYDSEGNVIKRETNITNVENYLGVDPRIIPANALVRMTDLYDGSNNESTVAYLDSKTMQWVEVNVSRYIYQDGNLVTSLEMHVDTLGAQIIESKTESEFDGQGRATSTIHYRRNHYEDTVTHTAYFKLDPNSRTTYEYAADGMTTSISSYWEGDSLGWVYSSKAITGTDSEGFYCTERYYYSDTTWYPNYKSAYKEVGPDAEGLTTNYRRNWYYDSSLQMWIFSDQSVFIYKDYRNLESQTWYYSDNLQALYLSQRHGDVYQGDTMYIGYWSMNYQEPRTAAELADQQPYSGRKEEHFTDEESGRTKTYINYTYQNGQWVPTDKSEYEYTLVTDSTSSYGGEYSQDWQTSLQAYYQWVAADNAWKETSKRINMFDAYGSDTLMLVYENDLLTGKTICQYKYFKDEEGYWKQCTLWEEYAYNQYDDKLIGQSKNEYDYDENGYQIMNASYSWGDDAWRGYYKSETLCDAQGRDTLTIAYEWDGERNVWYPYAKTHQVYNEEGETICYETFNGRYADGQTTWKGNYATYTTRNQNGDVTETISYNEWNTEYDTWWMGNRQAWAYDEQGILTEYASYSWNYETRSWKGMSREAYTFNDQKKKTSYTIYVWGETSNDWTPTYKYEYTYTESGLDKDNYQYMWSEGSHEWIPISRHVVTMEGGKFVSYLNSSYIAEMIPAEWRDYERGDYTYKADTVTLTVSSPDYMDVGWVASSKKIYVTDAYGNLLLDENYSWSDWDSTWVGNYKNETVFDPTTNISAQTSYNWDESSRSWVGYEKEESSYDEKGRLTMDASYTWDSSIPGWRGYSKDEYRFDEYDNTIYQASYYWDYSQNNWRGSSRYEYVYDSEGGQLGYTFYSWDSSKSDWRGYSRSYSESNDTLDYYEYYQWDYDNWSWKGTRKSEVHRDRFGNTIYYAYYYDWQDGDWVGDRKGSYLYDDYDRVVYSEQYDWDSDHKNWRGSDKKEYAYADNTSYTTSMRASYIWDEAAWCWIGDYKEVFEYDADGKRIMTTEYEWDKAAADWYGTSKYSQQTTSTAEMFRDVTTNWVWDATAKDWKLDTRVTLEEHFMPNTSLTSYELDIMEKYRNNAWSIAHILKTVYTYSPTAGIETVKTATWKVMAGEGQIKVEGENEQTAIRIHSLSGQQIATARGRIDINVPAGIYLVSVDGETLKVSVR